MNKTAFVREHPELSAPELVKLAADKHKTTLTTAHVHTIRYQLRKNAQSAPIEWRDIATLHQLRTANAPARRLASVPVAERGTFREQIEQASRHLVDGLLDVLRKSALGDLIE